MWDVEVREELPNKGRGLFALRDFKEDDVLFEEKPLVSCQFSWNALYKYEACDHCMKSLETSEEMARRLSGNPEIVLPHPECCSVNKELYTKCPQCQISYCSAECRDRAWETYHKMLCLGPSHEDPDHPLNKLCDIWRNIHYPPETATIMLIARMVACVKQASDRSSAIAAFSKFCKATVNEEAEIAHKLLGKEFQVQLDMLRTQLTEAMFCEDLQQWFSPEGFRSLFALIGTNGQGIGTSSLSAWVRACDDLTVPDNERTGLDSFIDVLYEDLDKESGQFLNCEGSGLYSLQSSCNHSCDPNVEVTFPHNNATLAVKALRDIKAGEEILISYLDCCQLQRSRHSRQKALRENYLFNCLCAKCLSEADDPDVTSEEEMDEEESLEVEDSFS